MVKRLGLVLLVLAGLIPSSHLLATDLDIRNGLFIGAQYGMNNEDLSSQTKVPCPICALDQSVVSLPSLDSHAKYPPTVVGWVNSLDSNITQALNELTDLNNLLLQAQIDNQSLSSRTLITSSDTSGYTNSLSTLESQISATIADLTSYIDNHVNSSDNQAVLSKYNSMLSEIKSLQSQITAEVDSYNSAIKSQLQNYNNAKSEYQNKLSQYNSDKSGYESANSGLEGAIGKAIDDVSNKNTGVQSSQALGEVTSDINNIMKGLASLERPDSYPWTGIWTQSSYQSAQTAGKDLTGVTYSCSNGTCTSNDPGKVATDLSSAQYKTIWPCFYNPRCSLDTETRQEQLEKFTETMSWFSYMAGLVAGNDTQRQELINDYRTFIQLFDQQLSDNGAQMLPTVSQAMQPAPTMTTPNTLSFNYKNFANAIAAVDSTKTSLVPMINSINRFTRPYANRSYNGSILLGYQSFFSKHFGYSIQGSVGYGYISSPLFAQQYFGSNILRSLQGVSVNLGADLYWDFNAPKDNSAAFYGIFVGLSGGSMNYDLSAESDIWRASYDFDLDLGLRFQFGANIFKVGADIPLLKHNINWEVGVTGHAPINFLMQQGIQDSGFFIQYDRIILWRASSFWAIIHRHLRKRTSVRRVYDPYRF
ncbi:hypothetical protein [Helicobacter suis]|uniref:hypothetical protein n=1 Tax=Helicobacter suis TaxID=104628 RepID=UPI0013D50556|nr:hypothetical protein [Helicobacter suis]